MHFTGCSGKFGALRENFAALQENFGALNTHIGKGYKPVLKVWQNS